MSKNIKFNSLDNLVNFIDNFTNEKSGGKDGLYLLDLLSKKTKKKF